MTLKKYQHFPDRSWFISLWNIRSCQMKQNKRLKLKLDHFDNTAITQFMSKMTLPLEKLGEKNCLKRKKGQKSEQCHGLQVEAWACLAKKKKVVVRLTKEKWKSHHHRHCLFFVVIVSSFSFSSLSPPSSSCVWEKSDRVDLSSARSGKMGECIFSSKRKNSLKIIETACYVVKSSFQIISINLNVILANLKWWKRGKN